MHKQQEDQYSVREIDTFMDEIKTTLARIEDQTTRHNGRMRAFEIWKAGIVGFLGAGSIIAGLLVYIWTTEINSIKSLDSRIDNQLQAHLATNTK